MANVICPMCGHLVYAPDGTQYVTCKECNYVIYIPDETHDRKTETET